MKAYLILLSLCCLAAFSQAGWVRVWADDFDWDGGVDPNKWEFDEGGSGWGNQELQFYTKNRKENARCEKFPGSNNGRLIIQARKEEFGGKHYTSARLKSKMSWTYGLLQIRAKLPSGRGLWPGLWMLPQKQSYGAQYWPDNGEMDLAEQVGVEPTKIHSTVHTQGYNWMKHNQPTNAVTVGNAATDFNIYSLQWDVNKVQMFVGDAAQPYKTRILVWDKKGDWTAWPFDKPFFVLMNLAVGGSWGGAQGVDDGIFPRQMEIDWVHYYQWK